MLPPLPLTRIRDLIASLLLIRLTRGVSMKLRTLTTPKKPSLKNVVAECIALLWVLALPLTAQCGGPWNMQELEKVPASKPTGRADEDRVRSVFFAGEPLVGMPTKVFAYIGLPEGASKTSRVPGVVCVHGGGGTAFAEW